MVAILEGLGEAGTGVVQKFFIIGGIIVGIIALVAVGLLIYFWKFKGGKGYPFLFYSPDGKNRKTFYAKLRTDPHNKKHKYFVFKELDSELPVKEPTMWIDGKAYREITQDVLNEFSYLKSRGLKYQGKDVDALDDATKEWLKNKKRNVVDYISNTEVDVSKYHDVGLEPQEKEIVLMHLKENERQYQNPVQKAQAIMLMSMFFMILILIIGTVFGTIKLSQATTSQVEAGRALKEVTTDLKAVANTNLQVTQQLASLQAQMSKQDVVRQVG